MQKNLVKLSYLAQKVLQRGRVPVLQLVDLPSMLTQNNGRKMPIFVTPCILPSHTGFKNIFNQNQVFGLGPKLKREIGQNFWPELKLTKTTKIYLQSQKLIILKSCFGHILIYGFLFSYKALFHDKMKKNVYILKISMK